VTTDHRPDQLGTGAPASDLDDIPATPEPEAETISPDSRSAQPELNRSGSGGTGGASEPGMSDEEGSTGATMDELLGGESGPAAGGG
jgi:hypothetical protein